MSALEAVVVCPCCEQAVPAGHPGRRGVLINKSATLGAQVVAYAAQLERMPAEAERRNLLWVRLTRAKKELAEVNEQIAKEPA